MSSFSGYMSIVRDNATEQTTDVISLDDFEDREYKPYEVITFNNKFTTNSETGEIKDLPLSCYYVDTIHTYVEHKLASNPQGHIKDPKTNSVFPKNQYHRIRFYKYFNSTFLGNMTEEHREIFMNGTDEERKTFAIDIIKQWEITPNDPYLKMLMKYCVKFNHITEYYGFNEIDSREKAMEYLSSEERTRNFVIRKSSVQDTKYYKFFVLQTVAGSCTLMVHIQGFGIVPVNCSRRHCSVNECVIDYNTPYYYPSMGSFILANKSLLC